MLVTARKTAYGKSCMEQAAEFLLLCFLIIPAKHGKSTKEKPGGVFREDISKTAKSKICSIPAAVPLALKWRLWYDYDMHHDMMRKREVHSVISYIRGPLEEKREDSVVVEAGNIGYRIFIPSSVLGELPGLGEEVKIYIVFFRA